LIFYSSCKKEENSSIPSIAVYSPEENEIFDVGDTIYVEAQVQDDKNINTIQVVLTDLNYQPVLPAKYFYPNATSYPLNTDYIIEDTKLPTRFYYLLVKANNNSSFKNKYQKIFINGISREFENLIVLTKKSNDLMQVWEVDEFNQVNSLFDINGDFTDSEINSADRQLYISGSDKINLQAHNIDNYELEWGIEATPPLPMHTYDCLHFDDYLFSSFYFAYSKGYQSDGMEVFNGITVDPDLPSRIYRHFNLVLVDLRSKSGGPTYIVTYYLVSGVEKQRLISTFKVLDFYLFSATEVLVIANNASGGMLKSYNPYINVITDLIEFSDPIISSEKMSNDEYIIGFENKIGLYNIQNNTYTDTQITGAPNNLRYRKLGSELLYIARGKEVEIYFFPYEQHQATIQMPDTILNIHLLYNK
jgi:hypothetical protein